MHTSMCKLANETHANIVNWQVTSVRVHANVCSLVSVEHASGVWDVVSEWYRILVP